MAVNMACLYLVTVTLFVAAYVEDVECGRYSQVYDDDQQDFKTEAATANVEPLNNYQCCKVGEKLAKKGLSCSAYQYTNQFSASGKFYVGHGDGHASNYVRDLSAQAAQCVRSYSLNLKKCCNLYEDYKLEMQACRHYRSGLNRRLCRDGVRSRYPF